MSADDLKSRTHLLENEIRIMRSEVQRINHSVQTLKDRIKENNERIKVILLIVGFCDVVVESDFQIFVFLPYARVVI